MEGNRHKLWLPVVKYDKIRKELTFLGKLFFWYFQKWSRTWSAMIPRWCIYSPIESIEVGSMS